MFVCSQHFKRNSTAVLGSLVVVIIACGSRDEPRFGDGRNI